MNIMEHVSRRAQRRVVRRNVRRTANALVAASRRYRGGTPAERSSHAALAAQLKHEMRAQFFAGVGRRIDLIALLNQMAADADGENRRPAWALVDPRQPIGPGNESHALHDDRGNAQWMRALDGHYAKGIAVGGVLVPVQHDCEVHYQSAQSAYGSLKVQGMPALPAEIRRQLRSPRLRQANMVGLLYQPEAWQEVQPDPALVVEWRDLPGEYYALAVWGHDGPRIMEFVD